MPGKRNFTAIFLFVVASCVLISFFTFTHYVRKGVEQRRAASLQNMSEIHAALLAYAHDNHNEFPDDPLKLYDKYIKDWQVFISPVWPDSNAYTYVTGIKPSGAANSDPPDTIVLLENVPAQKRKLGRLVLTLDGKVALVPEDQADTMLSAQEKRWTTADRRWKLVSVDVTAFLEASEKR